MGAAFLPLGTIWWPAAAVAAAPIPIGWRRGKDAINAFCELVEASIDIQQAALAEAFGVSLAPDGRISERSAGTINERLAKGDVRIIQEAKDTAR